MSDEIKRQENTDHNSYKKAKCNNASYSMRTGERLDVPVIARTKMSREVHQIGMGSIAP